MNTRAPLTALLLILLLAFLAGCATSSGTLFSDTVEADLSVVDAGGEDEPADTDTDAGTDDDTDSSQEPDSEDPDAEDPGITVRSLPSRARVYIDDEYVGRTPVLVTGLDAGSYEVVIVKDGFSPQTLWVDYTGESHTISAALEEITGIVQVITPHQDTVMLLNDEEIEENVAEVRIGTYELRVRAFGYQDYTEEIEVREKEVLSREITLDPAPFEITDLRASRRAFSPDNYGSLGTTTLSFRVTSFGRGSLAVVDGSGRELHRTEFPAFTTWDQEAIWTGNDPLGGVVPDGVYTVVLSADPADGSAPLRIETLVTVDRSLRITFRSLVSGAAGLLLAHSPEVLPQESAQIHALVMGHAQETATGNLYRFPANVGLRLGLGGLEINGQVGLYLLSGASGGELPLYASLSGRYPLLVPQGSGFGMAAAARLAYHRLPTDTLTNFTGFSVSLPMMAALGPVTLLLTPEIMASYTRFTYVAGASYPPALYGWAYLRTGIVLDVGPLTTGLSGAVRTLPFNDGLGISLPVSLGAEAHLMIPGTNVIVTLAALAELRSFQDYYIMFGGGLGLLH